MTDKPLTKTQLASLEGAYHKGDPYELRTDAYPDGKPWFARRYGNSTWRMVARLRSSGYLDNNNKLTVKGYAALHASKAAMKFIVEEALLQRWKDRQAEEAAAALKADAERLEREARRRIAEETSRRERLEKLRELTSEGWPATEDALLDFAARVHEIMEVY